jgi:hypothetical protein
LQFEALSIGVVVVVNTLDKYLISVKKKRVKKRCVSKQLVIKQKKNNIKVGKYIVTSKNDGLEFRKA